MRRVGSSGGSTKQRPRIVALLLAAGTASRFGTPKQLAPIESSATMVERAIRTLKKTGVDQIVVVLGSHAEEVRRMAGGAGPKVRFVLNPLYKTGLSSSLRAGVKAVADESEAIVVALVDQPLVTADLIDALIERYVSAKHRVVTAAAGDLIAPPVLFDRSLYPDLLRLEGDVGARAVVLSHEPFEKVEVERGVLLDVDTKRDLAAAKRALAAVRREEGRKERAQARGGRGRARPSS